MTVLLLRLAGPQQSWGATSRFSRRSTELEPTKSGVIGLIAAAQGRRRTDPVDDLVGLRLGVRVDQEGTLESDFQTAQRPDGTSMPLSRRYYLSDAKFLAGLETADDSLVDVLHEALLNPQFPLFLGRRAFPPSETVVVGRRTGDLSTVLAEEPWQASTWYRRRLGRRPSLRIVRDGRPGELGRRLRDVPESFDPTRRSYTWRTVVEESVLVDNPDGIDDHHDPMAVLLP